MTEKWCVSNLRCPLPADMWRLAAVLVLISGAVMADPIALKDRISGTLQMSEDLQSLQKNDSTNPAMLAVRAGEGLWHQKPPAGPACAGCHGDAATSMRGVAARFPATGRDGMVRDLTGQIQACQQDRQGLAPMARDSAPLLQLTAYVGLQSRGSAITPAPGSAMDAARRKGAALFQTRFGQIALSCAQCHDGLWGQKLAGSTIPQGHPTGYPIYRLEWQGMGSLHRRLRSCLTGVRAEPFANGSDELVALESYLMARAAGMSVETPAIRP